MAKFNKTTNTKVPDSINMAGGESFSRDDFRKEMASVILNSMLAGDSFYESESDRLNRIEKLIFDNIDNAEFIAKAMVYTRNEGNLRSISHFMGTLLAEKAKGTSFMKNALFKTMIRPDDATEMIALWNARNANKMIPNSIRKAVKGSLENKWDSYQLKKYYGAGNVKVSNLVQIGHPKPKDDSQRLMFKQAMEGTLPQISTAQTINAGSTGLNRADNYANLLKERKLGYMAALKNLKNILEAGISDDAFNALCDLLANEKVVVKSRVLPFRFTQAYAMVDNMNMDRIRIKKVLKAIEQGFIASARNIPIVDEGESVALLLDESGSMGGWNAEDLTSTSPFMIGKTLMASMLTGLDKDLTVGYLWADNAREISVDGSPIEFIKRTRTQGGGTDLRSAFEGLVRTKTFVNKVVIITDSQGWRSTARQLQDYVKMYKKINPNVKILFWNVEGYGGGTPLKLNHDVLEVSGFSDKILDVIPKIWKDKNALINEIEAIEI